MAGRKPTPTRLKELKGNPGHRALNDREPKFTKKAACPKHLKGEARKEWNRVKRELAPLGLLTSVDRMALAAYCTLWSRWIAAEEQIELLGLVVKTDKGN